jgi:hypothetical protein
MRWQLVGPRRALSLFVLGFCTTIFILVGLAQGGAWARCFYALAAAYGLAFFALAAEWFWARWYTMGLAASGITLAILGIITTGWNVALAIWGGVHLGIWAPLLGEAMAQRYEGQTAWRERYHLDDYGVARIKRAVKGAATALPTLIFFSLAPREGRGLLLVALPLLAAVGLIGVVRMRFWGVAVLGGACVAAALGVVFPEGQLQLQAGGALLPLQSVGLFAVLALGFAVSPFVVPAYRWLRR